MKFYKKLLSSSYSELLLIIIIFLFFLQGISDFIQSIYALNLIEVELNENVAGLLFLLTPLILMFIKKNIDDKILIILGELIIICRVIYPVLSVQPKMVVSGLSIGCFMLFLPIYLQKKSIGDEEKNGLLLGQAITIALIVSILFRVLGSTLDLSLTLWFQWIGWILAFIAGCILFNLKNLETREKQDATNNNVQKKPHANKWKILSLCLSLMSIITLIYLAFSSPTVISRWTEGNYVAIIAILSIIFSLTLLIIMYKPKTLNKLKFWPLFSWNIIFVILLVWTLLNNSIFFASIASYPYFAPEPTLLDQIILYAMLFSSPIILFDFVILTKELLGYKLSTRKMGGAFFISSGFFLVILLSAVFTIVWDYVPLGDLFRDMYWAVFLVIGLVLILPILLVKRENLPFSRIVDLNIKKNATLFALIVIICLSSIIGAIMFELKISHPTSTTSLKILSYNIQQGISENAELNFEGQYQVIQQLGPDIIGLQESDTCRISSGNGDIVRYINERLKMYSYFGPRTVTGTFGIALLSKYPILNPKTFYMESKGEQTATIWAQIVVGSTTFNIFVTHLGNYINMTEDPTDRSQIVQQENILSVVSGLNNVILMGDFNFEPNTEQYNITVAQLYDCWEVAPALGKTIGNVPVGWQTRLPDRRIDHIFVSGDLNSTISFITYAGGTASDHPCVFMTLTGAF